MKLPLSWLNDYVKVTGPSVWLVLGAVIILLCGVCVWGIFGRLDSTIRAAALCEKILTEHRAQPIGVAEYLLEHESIEGADFNFYCDNGYFPEPKPQPGMRDDSIERPARKIARFDEPESDESAEPTDGADNKPSDGDGYVIPPSNDDDQG